MMIRRRLCCLVLATACCAGGAGAAEPLGNLSPADALQAFETEPGFVVELAAAEPLVVDPVALAFDERGRLFVAENRDYPTGSPDGRPLGVIALLEDRDGDGVMDRRHEFAGDLHFPNGVMPWRGGVIVTAAPDVWWLADTNGDHQADVRTLLLTGFATNASSQLRANDPTLGPDGWVYVAGGLRGGKVSSPRRPGVVVDTDKGDLRFRPDTGELELVAGKSQFGLAFDDAGNRFACMNRIQSQHAPLPLRYLARHPFVVSPGALHNCPDIQDNTLMTRYTAGAARYYPISANLTTADSHLGTYSAACAVHVYRGTALPAAYWGAAFSCDPTGNLVRGDRLAKTGGTFAALRIQDGTEALRSRDNWFRPVFLADGPDGALYVADMYRKTIEHPEYLPGEVRRHTDFESGKGMGRIWRLRGAQPGKREPALARASTAKLVKTLSSPVPWARDTAFRLLLEQSVEPAAKVAMRGPGGGEAKDASLHSDAGGVIHAPARSVRLLAPAFARTRAAGPAVAQLRLLDLLGGLDDAVLSRALAHPEPAVRQNGVLLAESLLATNLNLRAAVLRLAGDSDPHVRFQVALSLGTPVSDPARSPNPTTPEGDRGEAITALARIASAQADDRWTRAAILSSVPDQAAAFALVAELARTPAAGDGALALAAELGRQTALRAGDHTAGALARLREVVATAAPEVQIAAVAGFAEAAGESFHAFLRAETTVGEAWFGTARAFVADAAQSEPRRLQGLRLLAFDEAPATAAALRELLAATVPRDLQTAAARALLRPGRAAVAPELLAADTWNQFTPALRTTILNTLAARPQFATALLDAVEAGTVPAGLLTPAQRDTLRNAQEPALRERAERLLTAVDGDREQAFAAAKAALTLTPAPATGRAAFERACASCHRLNQQGVAVGPDLFDIRHQPKESILYHIVVPGAEIAPNFVNYECELRDGRTLSGLLASESAGSITLRMAQGAEEIVPRAQIVRLTASRFSLMPEELERTMTLQELADLLAYLRGEQ